ncbi:MAG TPA: phage holin family protein [Thermoanaerobaculia bacterium]|jgi:hypothetical protein
MSTERAEPPGEDDERGWRDRFAEVSAAGRALIGTRLAILREELSDKGLLAARGLAALVVATTLTVGALLLAAALLAAVLAKLFGSVVLGILAAVVLYGAGAAAAAAYAFRTLARVRPFDFPVAAEEMSRDFQAIGAALAPEPEGPEADEDAEPLEDEEVADLEERLRRGTE